MRLPALLLTGTLALAACDAPGADPAPTAARLTAEHLFLDLSDGSRCKVDWRAAPSGSLATCASGLTYAVAAETKPNILRQLGEGLNLALGGDLLSPMAEVTVSGAHGRSWTFASPPPFDFGDW